MLTNRHLQGFFVISCREYFLHPTLYYLSFIKTIKSSGEMVFIIPC